MPEVGGSLTKEDVVRVGREVVEKVISVTDTYKHLEVGGWVDRINNETIQALLKLTTDNNYGLYKFVVDCTIVQRSEAGLSTAVKCYWNEQRDLAFTIRWDNNKHLHVLMHVFALPL